MRDAFADTGGPRRTWRRRATQVARRVLSLLAMAGTAACGEGIGVPARARTIDTNVDVEGSLIGAGQAEYALDVPASGGFTIVLTALVDSVLLQLTDASGRSVFPPVASTFRASIARPALSGEVRSSIGQRYRIAVTGRGRSR